MKEGIRAFGEDLSKDRNTMGLFYYAGHGCQVKGINYLIPLGADIRDENQIEYSGIEVGFVLSKMESAGNRINIMILDACRDNPFRSFRTATRGLTVVEAPKSSLIVYATAPGSVAADGKGRNGVFTGALLKNLGKNASLDIELFIRRVRKDVMVETGNDQVPWTSSSLTESISLKGSSGEETVASVPQKKELTGDLKIATPSREFADTDIIKRFQEKHPKVKVSVMMERDWGKYRQDTFSRLKSGVNAYDVVAMERNFLLQFTDSGYLDDLSAPPYNADTSDHYLYVVDAATDATGALRGLSWQATPGGIFYRRSLAKKYLGTDDPEHIGALLDSREKFLQTARLIKEKSRGRVKMIPRYNDYLPYPLSERTKAFVGKNKRFTLEPCVTDFFEFAKLLYDEGLAGALDFFSEPWLRTFNDTTPEYFCSIMPSWGLSYVLRSASRTRGDWGLYKGPSSYFMGGTWLGIYKGSRNKEAAWEFVKMMTQDRESMEWYAKTVGDCISNKAVVDKITNDFSEPILKGQNHYAFFAKEAGKIKEYLLELLHAAIANYVKGAMNKNQAITNFKGEVKRRFPDIIMD